MAEAAVVVEALTHRFEATTALDSVDLQVDAATIVALIGPNGAGKTTLVRILSTLLRPTSGRASVAGFDVISRPAEVRRRIGLTGQSVSLDQDLTASQNLIMFGRLLGLSRVEARRRAEELLFEFGLTEAAARPVRSYSGGMRRRLDLAASLIARPDILFLDEPTEGLDPASRIVLWEAVRGYARQGTTIFLTTHYLEEAEKLADRIVLIDRGRIQAEGSAEDLKHRVGERAVAVTLGGPGDLEQARHALETAGLTGLTVRDPNLLYVPVADGAMIVDVMGRLGASGALVTDVRIDAPSLDDVFLALTSREPTGDERTGDEKRRRGRAGGLRKRRDR